MIRLSYLLGAFLVLTQSDQEHDGEHWFATISQIVPGCLIKRLFSMATTFGQTIHYLPVKPSPDV